MLYLKNYNIHCNTKTWKQVIFIIMQDIFGEKYVDQHINFVQLAQPSDSEHPKEMPGNNEELIHLYDFQTFLDVLNLEY